MKYKMNELQLSIISSYVYVYLKSREDFVNVAPHDLKLEQRCEENLSLLSDILSVFLGKTIKPEHDFLHISTSLSREEFNDRVIAIVEAF